MATSNTSPRAVDDDVVAFEKAKAQFLAELSPDERATFTHCSSPKIILNELQGLQKFTKDRPILNRTIASVNKFTKHLSPYFEVLGILVQSHPEWAAIGWGCLRLILQLASNFIGFFEKLSNMLAKIGSLLPDFAEVLLLLQSAHRPSERLRMLVRNFYVDLFEFYRGVARVFTRKSGKLKKTPVVIGQLLWQPFDVRFSNFIECLNSHQKMLGIELGIMHLAVSLSNSQQQATLKLKLQDAQNEITKYNEILEQMKGNMTAQARDQSLQRTLQWLSPPDFKEDYEQHLDRKTEGTCDWLIKDSKFKSWRDTDPLCVKMAFPRHLLWVSGNPGCGKTTLAAAIIHELQSASADDPVCYFFFSYQRQRKQSHEEAFRAMLAQLIYQNRHDLDLLDTISFFMDVHGQGQLEASQGDILRLLPIVGSKFDSVTLILDGIDECYEPDLFLLNLQEAFAGVNVKALLLSRPNVDFLRTHLDEMQTIRVTRSRVEDDIATYLTGEVELMRSLQQIPTDAPEETLVRHLLSGADGMFLWARLMLNYLRSPALSRSSRLSIILNIEHPEKIEEMYLRICAHIAQGDRRSQQLARSVFQLLTYQKAPDRLSASAFYHAIGLGRKTMPSDNSFCTPDVAYQDQKEFEHSMIMVCGSLVEIHEASDGTGNPGRQVRFIHQSAFEFFRTQGRIDLARQFDTNNNLPALFTHYALADAELTSLTISYLLNQLPAGPLSGSMFEDVSVVLLAADFPFMRYAARNWPYHLEKMIQKLHDPTMRTDPWKTYFDRTFSLLTRLLSDKIRLMAWVEATYIFELWQDCREIHTTFGMLSDTTGDSSGVIADLDELRGDLLTLEQMWGDKLRAKPCHIWQDVTAFTQSRFLARTSAIDVEQLKEQGPSSPLILASRPLCKVSKPEAQGKFMSALTIWPSSSFETAWKAAAESHYTVQLDQCCSGWKAVYEIWDIASPNATKLGVYEIDINETEVKAHVRRFLRYEKGRPAAWGSGKCFEEEMVLPFPISIGSRVHVFFVLRTAYCCDPVSLCSLQQDNFNTIIHWRHCQIPVEADVIGLSINETLPNKLPIHSQGSRCDRSYRFSTCPNGRYLLYQTLDGFDYIMKREDGASSLKVFEVLPTKHTLSVKQLGSIDSGGYCLSKCSFHPYLPLLLMGVRHFGVSVALWCYSLPDSTGALNLQSELDASSSQRNIGGPIHIIDKKALYGDSSWNGTFETLQFSGSGEEIIIKDKSMDLPQVNLLQNSSIYHMAVQLEQSNLPKADLAIVQPNNTLTPIPTTRNLSLGPKSDLLQHFIEGKDNVQIAVARNGANTDIELTLKRNNVTRIQNLVSLPANYCTRNLSSTILQAPLAKSDYITVVLHQEPTMFSNLSKPPSNVDPTVIRKDKKALSRTVSQIGDSDRMGKIVSSFDDRSQKRLRL